MFARVKSKFAVIPNAYFTYHSVNILFGLIMALVIVYSIAFRANSHPLPALLTEITGALPPSKGLSSSFSEIVRGNLDLALAYNPFGIRVFSFFALQILMRIFFSLTISQRFLKLVIVLFVDVALSLGLFIWSFAPLISYTLRTFMALVQHLF